MVRLLFVSTAASRRAFWLYFPNIVLLINDYDYYRLVTIVLTWNVSQGI